MAEMVRNPDYLKRHLDVRDRVRNLETGVHFMGGELRYYDTISPTDINIIDSANWHSMDAFNNFYPARWQRRTGLIMLSGAVVLETDKTVPEQQTIATLPFEARPMQAVRIQVSADRAPFRTFIVAEPDGDLILFGGSFTGDTTSVQVYLDGAMWAVN
jgi:hypothetical protein